jgi:hypothetical protein
MLGHPGVAALEVAGLADYHGADAELAEESGESVVIMTQSA